MARHVPTLVEDMAGEAGRQPEPCTERCDEHYSLSGAGVVRHGCRIITFDFAVWAAAGTVGLLVVRLFWVPAEIKRTARLSTSSSARLDRWGSGGGWRRGWDGGAGRSGRRLPGAVLWFGRPCDNAATSSNSSSSMTCPRSSSSKELWIFFYCCAAASCTHSANCAADRRNSPGAVLGAGF